MAKITISVVIDATKTDLPMLRATLGGLLEEALSLQTREYVIVTAIENEG